MESMAARKERLGELLVREGLVDEQQLKEALHHQEMTAPHKPLGEICVGLGFISRSALKGVIQKYRKQILLGELLLRMRIVSGDQLREALSEQERVRKRLGQILLDKRYIAKPDLAEALSIQLGISKIVPASTWWIRSCCQKPRLITSSEIALSHCPASSRLTAGTRKELPSSWRIRSTSLPLPISERFSTRRLSQQSRQR